VAGSSSSSAVVPASNCTPFSLIARIGSTFYCVGTGRDITPTTSGKLYLGINSDYTGCSTPTVTATVTGGRSFDLIEPVEGAVLSNRSPVFSWQTASDAASGGVSYFFWVEQTNSTNTIIETVTTTQTSTTLSNVLIDGTYEWYVKASDAAKNPTQSVLRHFTIDTARPDEFTLSLYSDECMSVPTPSLCWDLAKDASGIASHQLYIDGALAATTTSACSTPTAALSQGQHSWYVVQTDRAGNWRQSRDTRQLWIDYTPPSAPGLAAPSDGASLVDPPVFTWTAATDNLAIKAYEVYVDGKLVATLSTDTLSHLSTTDLSLGNHTWYVRALDRCGQAGATAAQSFTMVACAPDAAQHPCPGYNRGPCRAGTRTCTATGTWSSCSDAVAPITETCNDIDDDCDGVVDNSTDHVRDNQCGGVCTVTPPYIGSECDGPDADLCSEGHIACNGLNGTVCVETTPNNVEVCNGRDDDCNGVIDDNCVQGGTGGTTSTGGSSSGSNGGSGAYGGMGSASGGVFVGTGGTGGPGGTIGANTSGGQTNYLSGGTSALSSTTNTTANGGAVANIGGAVANIGGAVANIGGAVVNIGGAVANIGGAVANIGGSGAGAGSSGFSSGGAASAGGSSGAGGQNSLTSAGGGQTLATIGGTNANVSTGSGLSVAGSFATQPGTLLNGDAGLDEGSSGSDSGCGCRVAPSTRSYRNLALMFCAALLLLRRRRAHW
jgi:hypothetical protein